MAKVYEDEFFVVSTTWYGPWRVLYKAANVTIAPQLLLQEQLGLIWPLIRKRQDLDPRIRRQCEDRLMRIFAMCAVNPESEMGVVFGQADKHWIADYVIKDVMETPTP